MNPEIVEQMEKDYSLLSERLRFPQTHGKLTEGEGTAMAGIARALATHYIAEQI